MTREASAIAEQRSAWRFDQGEEIVPGRSALDLLGGGRRYEVYLAWDERLHTVVAVKLLRPDRATDPEAVAGLRAEADALERLQHPVLPRCFGADLEGPRPNIVLEYLDGPRLSTLLRRYGPLAIEQVLPLGFQLAAALHYLHHEQTVHLDVKPKNVIMGAPPRLVDLSIVMTFEQARAHRTAIGTDAYMAPEQCGVPDRGDVGPRSDVWGLGVTLYEAMTGRLPYPRGSTEATDPAERFPQLHTAARPFPKDFPPQVTGPVMACLASRPSERPAVTEIAQAFGELIDALPKRPTITRRRPRI